MALSMDCPYDALAFNWSFLRVGKSIPFGHPISVRDAYPAALLLAEARRRLSTFNVLWSATDGYELAMSLACGDEL
jgi:hypothetical protein